MIVLSKYPGAIERILFRANGDMYLSALQNGTEYGWKHITDYSSDIDGLKMSIDEILSKSDDSLARYTGANNHFDEHAFENGSLNMGIDSTYRTASRVRTKEWITAPYTFIVSTESTYGFVVFTRDGDDTDVVSSNWIFAPDSYTINRGQSYRILMCDSSRISTTDVITVQEMLEHFFVFSEDAAVLDNLKANTIITRNPDAEERLTSLKRHVHDLRGGSAARRLNHNNLFCIAHISDIHLDTKRYGNFIEFCDKYNDYIDARICTGDFVNDPTDEQIAHMRDYEATKTVLWCDGNHERHGTNTGLTRRQVYEKWGLASWYADTGVTPPVGYTAEVGREDYQTVFDYPLYYYKDFANDDSVSGYKIRLIVLNCCDMRTDPSTTSTLPRYTTEQMRWFVDVLQDAAANGYAVIVAQHYMESSIAPADNVSFYVRDNKDETEMLEPDNGDITIVENIIDAFRNGTAYIETNVLIKQDDSANSRLSVTADFRDNQGVFLAWMVGHSHRDRIGYSKNHPDQLILQVVDGCYDATMAGITNRDMSNNSDLPRIEGERSEDAFNVYAFDPVNKLCKVMRVGSYLNDMMEPREYACFSTEPTINL